MSQLNQSVKIINYKKLQHNERAKELQYNERDGELRYNKSDRVNKL